MSELENIKAVLGYLNTVENTENYKKNPPSLNDWLELERKRLNKEYFNLYIIDAEDNEIISQALIEMANNYRDNNQTQISDKICDKICEVRKRFLDNETEKYVKSNLNFYIKVKLNDYGKQIHRDYWKDICRDTHIPYKLEIDEEGYSLFQMHDFMNIFGEHAYVGAKPFLETNDVLIERSKK